VTYPFIVVVEEIFIEEEELFASREKFYNEIDFEKKNLKMHKEKKELIKILLPEQEDIEMALLDFSIYMAKEVAGLDLSTLTFLK
jgi:hypothetical protein